MWRAARNASSVNGGRLPYSLGTVASAARPSQLNTARQTSLGRFRPIASISQEVLTRKEGTMPLAPCPLCAASIHPSPHEVGRRRRREEGVYTKALTHAHRIVRAHIRAEEARWRSICFLSPSLPPSRAVPGAPPATHATTHRHAASANHQQQIALAGVTLAAAAASARHQYVLLALALVLICTGWRATLTRFSALGQPSTPASVTLAVTAASA